MIWPPFLVRMALTASGTARVCSMVLLLLSMAPWASIYYALFCSSSVSHTVQEELSLEQVLQQEHATIEELWRALFHHGSISRARFMTWNETNVAAVTMTRPHHEYQHHWTIVLPWGISLAFGVLVPLFLTLCTYLQDDYPLVIDPENDDPWISRHVKERRLDRLICACQHYRKVLTKDDLADDTGNPKDDCHNNTNNNKTTISDHEHLSSRWNLPLPGSTLMESNQNTTSTRRSVEGTCAVCLSSYTIGDSIIWSSNSKCIHVFHDDCILSWLLRRREQQCPCCRQSFVISTK